MIEDFHSSVVSFVVEFRSHFCSGLCPTRDFLLDFVTRIDDFYDESALFLNDSDYEDVVLLSDYAHDILSILSCFDSSFH